MSGGSQGQAAVVNSYLFPIGATSPLYQDGAWYHSDGLGSVRALTSDSTGAVVNTYAYSAFGLNAGEMGKAGNSHEFAGEQLDPTSLYYDRARYYSSGTGRFTQRDSYAGQVQWPGSLNRYDYVLNNPTDLIDPSGFTPANPAPLCKDQSCGCSVDLFISSVHIGIEFVNNCTNQKSTFEAAPYGGRDDDFTNKKDGLGVYQLAERFETQHVYPNSSQANGKLHAERPYKSSDGKACDRIYECLKEQTDNVVNNYPEIQQNCLTVNGIKFCYINMDLPYLSGFVLGVGFGGLIGVNFGGIGFVPGVFIGGVVGIGLGFVNWAQTSIHQNSNTMARLMSKKCIPGGLVKPFNWFAPGWDERDSVNKGSYERG